MNKSSLVLPTKHKSKVLTSIYYTDETTGFTGQTGERLLDYAKAHGFSDTKLSLHHKRLNHNRISCLFFMYFVEP